MNMKKICKLLCIIVCMCMCWGMQAKATAPTTAIGPVNGYGFLMGPDGNPWTYTAAFTKQNGYYTTAVVEVYNAENQLVGKIVDSLNINDPNVTGVRDLQVVNFVTKKFFNFDNNYELMFLITANTKQYVNKYFNRIYSISDSEISTEPVCEMPGNMVASKNIGEYNENYTVIFKRDSSDIHYFDVYTKASYASPDAPELKHTFQTPYANLAALNDLFPIFMVKNGAYINYFTVQYEKPFFVPNTPWDQDPVVNENNALVIKQYNQKFEEVGETKIPMAKDPDPAYLYTFYCLGNLSGENDIILNYNGTGKPAFVITEDNYAIASDGSVFSYRLYDSEGQLLSTIVEHSLGTLHLSDVAGHERQYGFMKNENEVEFVQFVDVPSCKTTARVALNNNGDVLSGNWDRVAKGDSYQYVVSLLQGTTLADGSVEQRIAWLTNKGKVDHYDAINLGQKVEAANVWIAAPVLNPHLFNTDDAYEYATLIKRTGVNGNILLVCSTNGQTLLEVGADETLGGSLNMVDVVNGQANNPSLLCVHTDGNTFTLNYFALPLSKTEIQGQGTAEDPYQITSVSDFMQIDEHPAAYYQIMNDIDFGAVPFKGLTQPFSGKLNGGKYALKNLSLDNSGLFAEIVDTAVIKDLKLENPIMVLSEHAVTAGFLVNRARGGFGEAEGAEFHALISNVHVHNPTIQAANFTGVVGGIVGEASLFTEIVKVSLLDADITAPLAEQVGGIVGSLATGSHVHVAAVSGTIHGGAIVGGIAGSVSSDNPIYHCHVNADLEGTHTIGGVVGKSARSAVYNCLVEGSVQLELTADANDHVAGNAGGVVGMLEADILGTSTAIVVENCLVGLSQMEAQLSSVPQTYEIAAHRIVGYTSADSYEYDWDNIDYNKPQAEWPRIYGKPEACLKGNYVISDLAALDATIEKIDTTTEGSDLAASDMTIDWLAAHGFALGSEFDAPWKLTDQLVLWFESDGIFTGVENVCVEDTNSATRKIISNGQILIIRDGKVYNVLGTRL